MLVYDTFMGKVHIQVILHFITHIHILVGHDIMTILCERMYQLGNWLVNIAVNNYPTLYNKVIEFLSCITISPYFCSNNNSIYHMSYK